MPERPVSALRFRHCRPINLPKSLPSDGTWEQPALRANDLSGYADDPSEAPVRRVLTRLVGRVKMKDQERSRAPWHREKTGSQAVRQQASKDLNVLTLC